MIDRNQLRGLSKEKAELYGLPHIGAHYKTTGFKYKRNGARNYEKTSDFCAICGKPATNCHHIVPISYGQVFDLVTKNGSWPLRSPLIAVCGSGTTGCHGKFHSGQLKIRWVWDLPKSETDWWSGVLLNDFSPHHQGLYGFGYWQITDTKTGITKNYRELF